MMFDRFRAGRTTGLVLFATAFVLRAVYVATGDGRTPFELDRAGGTLALTGEIKNVLGPFSGPSAHLMPLPVLLRASIEWLFGPRTQASWYAAAMVWSVAASLTIALLQTLAKKLRLSEPAAVVAAMVLAVTPFGLWLDSEPGHETSLVALALMGVLLFYLDARAARWEDGRSIVKFCALCGIAALLSPPVLLTAIALIGLEFVARSEARANVFKTGSLVALTVAVALLPWIYRNFILFGQLIPLRSNFGLELHLGNHDHADGRTYAPKFESMHPFIDSGEREILKQMGEPAYMRSKLAAAKAWIWDNPLGFLRLSLHRSRQAWMPSPAMWERTHAPSGRLVRSAWYSFIGFLALLELLRLAWTRHSATPVLLVVIVAYSAIYWVTHVDMRYAHPLGGLRALLAVEFVFALALGGWARVGIAGAARANPR
jgi:hypothetical protein